MKQVIRTLLAALILDAVCVTASFAEEWIRELDVHEAADLLARAEFTYPAEAVKLWEGNDGLPGLDAAEFPRAAGRFLAEHPVPPPDASSSAWTLDKMASRQCKCLAYLASGKKEGKLEVALLCVAQGLRIQWTLPIRMGSRRAPDHAFYAATGSLSLTGGLLRRNAEKGTLPYEVATQWLRTGRGQFATYGQTQKEKGKAEAARALIDVAPPDAEALEIHGTDAQFFQQLDLTRPDMQRVAVHAADGNWQRAKEAYAEVLSERFSSKRGWPDIRFWKTIDIAEADDICRNVFILRAHMFRRLDYGEKVDWAAVIDNDIESRVWMNHHPWMWSLVNAYRETRDEKYVKHLCRLFNSWYETSPPTFKRSSAQWRTLEVGGRTGQKWGVALLALAENPTFKRECLFNMARSMLDHGKYLSMYAAGGGNWLQVESSGLACVALLYPEFKLSGLFYEVAMNRLAWVNARSFLPDGFQSECSPGYHRFPLIGIASALRIATFLDTPVPESLMTQYEAGVAALQYIAYPDLTLPMLSDQSPARHPAVEVLETGAEVFGREDFRWFATTGREGTPPAQPSHDFTHAGYCVMRDRWGPDGQVLIFDAGYFGSGHQHEDKLNFVYYAGGRELIGDPCIYSYKRDEFEPYWRGSWSHNTIVIDGLSQHRKLGPPEDVPDPDRRFVIGDSFDFAVGWYKHAYSPRKTVLRSGNTTSDSQAAIRNVRHQRCIFYLKGRYAVICDRVLGEGEHQVDILFHPAPIVTGSGTQRTVRAVDLEIKPNGTLVTKESKHANVAILPAQGENLEVLDLIGQKNPVRGWYALYGVQPSHNVVYRCRAELPRHSETVVQPLPPGDAEPMDVRALEVTSENGITCAGVSCGDDLLVVSYDGSAEMTCGNIRYHGTALLMRRDASGKPTRANMVDGKLLSIDGKEIFSTETTTPARSINLNGK